MELMLIALTALNIQVAVNDNPLIKVYEPINLVIQKPPDKPQPVLSQKPTVKTVKAKKPVRTQPSAKPAPKPAPKLGGILGLINQARASRGIAELYASKHLDNSSREKCAHMVEHHYWAHSGGGREWSSFIYYHGGKGAVNEILGKSYQGQTLINAWLDSPAHNSVMLSAVYGLFGSASCTNRDGEVITVVHFD